MTADDKHYLLNKDYLTQPNQMEVSQKQKIFSGFFSFFAFLKSILNFKHFLKKDGPHSWCVSGNTSSEKDGYINVSEVVFQSTLQRKHGRAVETLLQPEWQNSIIFINHCESNDVGKSSF